MFNIDINNENIKIKFDINIFDHFQMTSPLHVLLKTRVHSGSLGLRNVNGCFFNIDIDIEIFNVVFDVKCSPPLDALYGTSLYSSVDL